MITTVVNQYIDIINNIDKMIESSPFKPKYIIDKMGMKTSTFYKKVREKKFTPEEVLTLAQIIDVENTTRLEILNSREQARQGITIDHDDVMEEAYRMVEEV